MLSTLAFAGMIATTWGHGRLIKPTTRIGNDGYENDPIGFGGRPQSQFICRHEKPNPNVTPAEVTVGSPMTVSWRLTAAHVGDCALYMSYDTDNDLEDMRWFKIANKKDCKSFTGQDVNFDLPTWLPAGKATLRWEWYALHVYPTIEFYAQCADIVVSNPTGNAISKGDIPTFKVFDNGVKQTLPINGNTAPGFRNAFSNGEQFFTGPECALGSTLNGCEFTAEGTTGHVAMETSNTSPITIPTQQPTQPVAQPTKQPTNPPVVTPTEPPVVTPTEPPVVTPTQPPVVSPTQPPVQTGDCTTALYNEFEQCAGEGTWAQKPNPNGCPLCPAGMQCYKASRWYSNCNKACPIGYGYECEDSLVAPTQPPVEAPTGNGDGAGSAGPPVQPPTQNPTDADSCPNGEWATCGGKGQIIGPLPTQWSGQRCCQDGLVCVKKSRWYRQCLKPESA